MKYEHLHQVMVRARLKSIDRGIKAVVSALTTCAMLLFMLVLHSCIGEQNHNIVHELKMIKQEVTK